MSKFQKNRIGLSVLLGLLSVWITSTGNAAPSRPQTMQRDKTEHSDESAIDNLPDVFVEREWLQPMYMLTGLDNTFVAKRVDDLPASDLYRCVTTTPDPGSGESTESIRHATRTISFQENVSEVSFVRSTLALYDDATPLRHTRTVVLCPNSVCAVFDEVMAVSEGAYVLGPVWHLKEEASRSLNATGIQFGKGGNRIELLSLGPDEWIQPEMVDGPAVQPSEAQCHLYCLAGRNLKEKEIARFCTVFLPVPGQQSLPVWPFPSEGGVNGLAVVNVEGTSAIIIGSGHMGTLTDYGQMKTDAACFLAGDRDQTAFVHFVKATTISVPADSVIQEVRLDGAVLPFGSWQFKEGRIQVKWSEPKSGVLAIVTLPLDVPNPR
ncbi:MAG: hypothetical protein ABIH23_25550 [bacterium]